MQEFPDFATRVLRMASEHLRRDQNRGVDVSQVRLRPVIADVLTRPQGVSQSTRGSVSSPTGGGGSGPIGGSSFAVIKKTSTGGAVNVMASPAGGSRRGSTSSDRDAQADARLNRAQQASSMETILKELAAVRGDLRDLRRNSGAQLYEEPPSKMGGRAGSFKSAELPSDFKSGDSPQSPAPAPLATRATSPSNVPEARAKDAPSPSYQKNTAKIFG